MAMFDGILRRRFDDGLMSGLIHSCQVQDNNTNIHAIHAT